MNIVDRAVSRARAFASATEAQWAKAGALAGLALASVSSHAAGGTSIDSLFDEIDLSGVAAKITALAVLIVGIAFVMKGPSIVKRLISKI